MTIDVTVSIPDEMYRHAERLARLREQTVAEVLLNSIVLPEVEEESEDVDVAREEAAFKRLHPMLRGKYFGQYVAIYQGELIDHDADQVALFLRTKEKHPNQFIWIAPVREEPIETFYIRPSRLPENNS